jgi:hypothetical protein
MQRVRLAFVALVLGGLALVGGGCVTANTVTEEDRKVFHYNREAWALAAAATAAMGGDPAAQLAAVQLVASKYGMPLSEQLVKAWGPPKVAPEPISEDAVKKAIAGSTTSHAQPWWQTAGLTLLGAIPVLLGIGTKFARYLPGGAAIWDVAAGTFGAIEAFIAKRKEAGDTGTVQALVDTLSHAHKDPRLKSIAEKILFEAKKRLGIDPTAAPDEDPTPPTPAPAT